MEWTEDESRSGRCWDLKSHGRKVFSWVMAPHPVTADDVCEWRVHMQKWDIPQSFHGTRQEAMDYIVSLVVLERMGDSDG